MADNLDSIKEQVLQTLKKIYDPEIPVNIYDIGLIYDIKVTEQKEVVVLMTLTAPNCPVAESLPAQVEFDIKEIPEVSDAKVIITFEPPWTKDNLSEEAKLELGFL